MEHCSPGDGSRRSSSSSSITAFPRPMRYFGCGMGISFTRPIYTIYTIYGDSIPGHLRPLIVLFVLFVAR